MKARTVGDVPVHPSFTEVRVSYRSYDGSSREPTAALVDDNRRSRVSYGDNSNIIPESRARERVRAWVRGMYVQY